MYDYLTVHVLVHVSISECIYVSCLGIVHMSTLWACVFTCDLYACECMCVHISMCICMCEYIHLCLCVHLSTL